MKALILILIVYITFLMVWPVNVYSEDSASSGVIVFGPSIKNSNATTVDQVKSFDADKPEKIESSSLSTNSRILLEISGSKIGDIKVSQPVTLPADGEIVFVDVGVSRAFIVYKVDGEGRETLALNASPENAIGQKLAKGTYKVYPVDLDGTLVLQKLTVRIQVGLAENRIEGLRKIGEIGNVMIPGNPEEAK